MATTNTSVTPQLDSLSLDYDPIGTTVSSPNGGETVFLTQQLPLRPLLGQQPLVVPLIIFVYSTQLTQAVHTVILVEQQP